MWKRNKDVGNPHLFDRDKERRVFSRDMADKLRVRDKRLVDYTRYRKSDPMTE